jgi:hypothetical protein
MPGVRNTAAALVGGAALLGSLVVPAPASAVVPSRLVATAPARHVVMVDLTSSKTTTTTARNKSAAAKPKTVQVGHSTFWECKTPSTKVLVALSSLTLRVGTPLTLNFVVRNTGTAACNYVAPYADVAPGPTASVLQAGPCGSIGFDVVAANKHNVWPGPAAFNCPALGFAQLQPGASVSGSGTWAENKPGSTAHVAPGRYTVVVDGHFRFPVRVVG